MYCTGRYKTGSDMSEQIEIPPLLPRGGDVQGKRVVLTGAEPRPRPAARARASRRPARVVALVARTEADLKERRRRAARARRSCAPATSTDEAFNEAVADATVAEWGGVDVWISNAGISPIVAGPRRDRPRGLARGARGEPHRPPSSAPAPRPASWATAAGSSSPARCSASGRARASPRTARRRPGSSAWPRGWRSTSRRHGITVNVVAPGWFDSPLADGWKSNPKLSAADPRAHRAAAVGPRHRPRRRVPVPRVRRLGVRHRHRPQRRRGVPARMTRRVVVINGAGGALGAALSAPLRRASPTPTSC